MKMKCIDDSGYNDLTLGKIYEVEDSWDGWVVVLIERGRNKAYSSKRFEEVGKEENTMSMKMKCIDDAFCSPLTLGKNILVA